MAIKRPQSELPRSLSGGSDLWDNGLVGQILSNDFFPTETVVTDETLLKYWNGTAWVSKPLKYFNSSQWEAAPLKRRTASTWVEA